MRRDDYLFALALVLLAVFIWFRDTAWMTSSDDTLPIIVALPLFVWLNTWQWKSTPAHYSTSLLAIGICVFVSGIGLNITLLLTIGWVVLLSVWLTARLEDEVLPSYYKLLALPILAFPWISLDLSQLGWWFRLSGAWITEEVFALTTLPVVREGTLLNINGIPISIEVACAGLNTLQSMLISGTIVAYLLLANTARYWLAFPILIFLAWVANTIRILVICLLALIVSPEFVMGPFHTWGAWGVLMLMFGLCWVTLSALEPKEQR